MAEDRANRRLAAIFAGDIAGYSRLMGVDEEGTLRQLKLHRKELVDPKIIEHRGRIVKTTGDGLLVEFSSAVDAVRCAVEIQREMAARNAEIGPDKRIEFRIGINVGDIIIDESDIFGDGVNVAARMEGLAKPGGIMVSRTVHDQVSDKLNFSFEDLGEQSVKNIARPVRAYRIEMERGAPTKMSFDVDAVLRRPAIAVLPFENLTKDPEQDYFADGLTEDIITALSCWRLFPVIARNSTFAYKGRAIKVQQLAQELAARYVIEGSVRKGGDRIRVTVQLIDGATGHHLWAERYDRRIDDIALQDEITERIVAMVAPELERVERQRAVSKPPSDLFAWDFYLRDMSSLHEFTREGTEAARKMFERAVALDPNYSRGHTGIAYSHYRDVMFAQVDDPQSSLRKCLETAQTAVALDDTDAFGHFVLSRGLHRAGRLDHALQEARQSIQLNPNDSGSHASLGAILISTGRADEGIAELERAFQLNPKDPRTYVYQNILSSGHFAAGRLAEAAKVARDVLGRHPSDQTARIFLASSLALDAAVTEARTVLDQDRTITTALIERLGVINWLPPRDRDRRRQGLDLAAVAG